MNVLGTSKVVCDRDAAKALSRSLRNSCSGIADAFVTAGRPRSAHGNTSGIVPGLSKSRGVRACG